MSGSNDGSKRASSDEWGSLFTTISFGLLLCATAGELYFMYMFITAAFNSPDPYMSLEFMIATAIGGIFFGSIWFLVLWNRSIMELIRVSKNSGTRG